MNNWKTVWSASSPEDEEINIYLQTLGERWRQEGIEFFAYAKNGDITVSQIIIPNEDRKKGVGTAKMQELLSFANDRGYRVLLTPSVDFGATSKSRLEKFYRGLGFSHNRGRNKDYRTRETMIWRPDNYG